MEQLLPAIVAVGYNRPDTLRRLLDSIGAASYPAGDVPLIISLDNSDNQDRVAAVAEAFPWPHGKKAVRTFPQRQGLRSHILQCGDLSHAYGAVIILEDDLLVSPDFYDYTVQALAFYGEDPALAGVSLYSHAWNGYAEYPFIPENNGFDAYLGQYSITWGQCWTADGWQGFRNWYEENDGKLDRLYPRMPADVSRWPETSWGKYFAGYLVDKDRYYVIPYVSLSTNCEEAGQHAAGTSDAHQTPLLACNARPWRFPAIQEAVRYDLFFERVFADGQPIASVPAGDVCVDLHGSKSNTEGKRYLLTTRRYALPVVASFGLRLRPVEANVTAQIPGDQIRLYDAGDGLPHSGRLAEHRRLQYELYRFDWRRLLPYALRTMGTKLLGRIRRAITSICK